MAIFTGVVLGTALGSVCYKGIQTYQSPHWVYRQLKKYTTGESFADSNIYLGALKISQCFVFQGSERIYCESLKTALSDRIIKEWEGSLNQIEKKGGVFERIEHLGEIIKGAQLHLKLGAMRQFELQFWLNKYPQVQIQRVKMEEIDNRTRKLIAQSLDRLFQDIKIALTVSSGGRVLNTLRIDKSKENEFSRLVYHWIDTLWHKSHSLSSDR